MEIDMTPKDFILAEGEEYVQCPYNEAHIVTNQKLGTHLTKCRRQYEKDCKAAGKRMEYKSCRFNDKHRELALEMRFHEQSCPDQYKVVNTIRYHQSDDFKRRQEEDEQRRQERERERHAEKKHKPHDKDRHSYGDRDRKDGSSSSSRHRHRNDIPDVKPNLLDPDNIWGETAEDWEAEAKGYEAAYNPELKLKEEVILYQPRGLSKSERKQFRMEQRAKAQGMEFQKAEVDEKPMANLGLNLKEELKVKQEYKPDIKIKQEVIRKPPPPKVEPRPEDLEKEDGECSDEGGYDYYGEDPFA